MTAHRALWLCFVCVMVCHQIRDVYSTPMKNKRSPSRNTVRYTVHEKPPELVVNADPEGVQVQAKPSKLQVIAYPHLQPFHPFEHTSVLGPHSPPVNIGPNAPPVQIASHVPSIHMSPRVPSLHFGTNAPLLHVRPHMPFVHMTPPVHAINALTGPPVHVLSPSTVYHQPPILFHQPHFAYPGFGYGGFHGGFGGFHGGFGGFHGGYGGGFYGRSAIPGNEKDDEGTRMKRDLESPRFRRQWFGWHPFPHTVNVGPHTPPIHVGPHYPPVHIGPHVPAVHIGPHVPVINVPSHVPAIHVRPHVPAVHLGPPVPIINAGNHFPAVHVTSPPTIYHRPPIVIHQPHIVHPYGGWKKRSKIAKLRKQDKVKSSSENENKEKDIKSKRQVFSNANSGPNGDSVIFVHPQGDHNAAGLGDIGGHSNPLESSPAGDSFGDISKFGENFNPSSFGEDNGLGAGAEGLGGLTGGAPEGGANSFTETPGGAGLGGLGGLGAQSVPDLGGTGLGGAGFGGAGISGQSLGGGMGGLGAGMTGQMPAGLGGLGGEESRKSSVPRSFIPGRLRLITKGYLQRNPLDDGRSATIVKKTSIPRPGQ